MADWFRHSRWDAEIAADFDARLGRARQKGQYLTIQAYHLLTTRPDIAAALCRRAIALGEPMAGVTGGLYLGTALALQDDLDGAIDALEAAIEVQSRHPMTRSAAYLDQALLVALARRADLVDRSVERLAEEASLPLEEVGLSALIALALLRQLAGQDGGPAAREALGLLGDAAGEEAGVPHYLDLDHIRERLRACL